MIICMNVSLIGRGSQRERSNYGNLDRIAPKEDPHKK